jgi:alpha-ribazole phosphatase
MINIYFVRHGETDLNAQHIVQGHIDTHGLNDKGRAQAAGLVEAIAASGLKGDAILSSPLRRASETAEPLSAYFDVSIDMDDRLKEMNFGLCEGMTTKDVRAMVFDPPRLCGDVVISNGEELRQYHLFTDPRYDAVAHPEGESKLQVRERGCAAVLDYLKQHPGVKNLWVVSHGAIARFMISHFAYPRKIEDIVQHASISHFVYDPAHPDRLEFKDVVHKPGD